MESLKEPLIGATVVAGGTWFGVWAPRAQRVDVMLEAGNSVLPMSQGAAGYFVCFANGVQAGALYRYRVDGGTAYPDPASRFQPLGVHGPSMVVDPARYAWRDADWQGIAQKDLVFYELHVGTYTPSGSFNGVRERLPYLRDLGITALELLPLADFPGRWNWGYDPAAMFAPSRAYGEPDDLRALVDAAHRDGMAVFLDVVYNHFGPDGAYAPALSPLFFSARHHTAWGPAVNLDGEGAASVRHFFSCNALAWLSEYHLDGLRLDATFALHDDSPQHFLAELAEKVVQLPGPRRYLIAEDPRNLNTLVRPQTSGGYGLDGVWVDDFHHQVRCSLTGENEGYYADYQPGTQAIADTVNRGWLFTGQHSVHLNGPRGTDPTGLAPEHMVFCLQNHDQVGNRARGDRLTATVDLAAYRAASALLLFVPELPLLFMGQEWAATTPFMFFTDHAPELGKQVSAGRKAEFKSFTSFGGEVPDPQDEATFLQSRLRWDEAARAPHAGILALYRDLLARRRALVGPVQATSEVEGGLRLVRGEYVLLVALTRELTLAVPNDAEVIWHTEHKTYVETPLPPQRQHQAIHFFRAAAVLLRSVARGR